LYKLAVNDKMKTEFFFRMSGGLYLRTIVLRGNRYEAKYALRCLAQLSFDHNIAAELSHDSEFCSFLAAQMHEEEYNQMEDANHKQPHQPTAGEFTTFNICTRINWNISQLTVLFKSSGLVLHHIGGEQHIMISYHQTSAAMCFRIKRSLEAGGVFRVWMMDPADAHSGGNSLDTMANAIDQSFCVLVCVSEKYRQSINCQCEAQYAHKMNKPVIPCVVQQGYESCGGWLGRLLNTIALTRSPRISMINFMRYRFDEAMRRLWGEIGRYRKIPPQSKVIVPSPPIPPPKQNPPATKKAAPPPPLPQQTQPAPLIREPPVIKEVIKIEGLHF
jgi:hypothetical protein